MTPTAWIESKPWELAEQASAKAEAETEILDQVCVVISGLTTDRTRQLRTLLLWNDSER